MSDDGWSRTAKGTILAHPLTSFQASEQGLKMLWRLEWSEATPGSGHRRAKSVQVYVDSEYALEIGRELIRCAQASPSSDAGTA